MKNKPSREAIKTMYQMFHDKSLPRRFDKEGKKKDTKVS